MSLLKYVKKEEASGAVAAVYNLMEERVKFIPNVIKFHTASPEFFEKYMQLVSHFTDHPIFESRMVAYIRLLVSNRANGKYCIQLQSAILKSFGVPEDDLQKALTDYTQVNLEPRQKALVCFVVDEMFDNLDNKIKRIDELRSFGWTDKDIYEASIIGGLQIGMVKLINTFEVQSDF